MKSVTDEDLWDSFRDVECLELDLPVDIADLMHNWIHMKGHPTIDVERIRNESAPIHLIKLRQAISWNEDTYQKPDTRWWVPLSYTTSTELDFDDTEPKEWFNISSEEHMLDVYLEEDEWIIINLQLSGFYRVNYDEYTWKLITEDMIDNGFHDIHPLNRAALLHDSFYLAQSGDLEFEIALNLSKYLVRETDFIPWTTAEEIFKDLDMKLSNTAAYPLFHKYIRWLVACWSAEIGFDESENDTDTTKLSRMVFTRIACGFGTKACKEKALEQVYLMMSDAEVKLSTELQQTYLCVAITIGPSEVWEYVRKQYMEAPKNNKKVRESLLESMACTVDSKIRKQMLKDSIDEDSFLTKSDAAHLIVAIISRTGRNDFDLILDFFSENIQELLNLHGASKVRSFFVRIALKSNSNSILKIQSFVDNYEELKFLMRLTHSIQQKLNFAEYNMLKEEHYNQLYEWLLKEESNYEKEDENNFDEDIIEIEDGDDYDDDDDDDDNEEHVSVPMKNENTSSEITTNEIDNTGTPLVMSGATTEAFATSSSTIQPFDHEADSDDTTEHENTYDTDDETSHQNPTVISNNEKQPNRSSSASFTIQNTNIYLGSVIQLLMISVILLLY